MTDPMIQVSGIKKAYRSGVFGSRVSNALNGIDLSVMEGELFGILGPNGAGKTTLMNVIMGLLYPDAGCVKIAGMETCGMFSHEVRNMMNMSSGNPNYPWALTIKEMLVFYGMLYGMIGKKLDMKADSLIELLGLQKYKDTRFDELSTGTKQRMSIAKALLNDPKLLLLDEPTTGMDPNISLKIRAIIKQLHAERKMTILLTTHYMREAEELCGRVAFIKDGRVAALGTKEEIKHMTAAHDMEEAFLEINAD
ncbi:MAG: ABC transporter ATP-binding protein [Spirochaetia bacterium]|nr:ABC transporter ATP-binding protein [Spirochaetia bacterium]